MTMDTKANNNGSDTGTSISNETDHHPQHFDHHHPNHTILTMCGTDNNKATKLAPCQSEIDIAEPVSFLFSIALQILMMMSLLL